MRLSVLVERGCDELAERWTLVGKFDFVWLIGELLKTPVRTERVEVQMR